MNTYPSPLVLVAVFILTYAVSNALWPDDILLMLAIPAITSGVYMMRSASTKKGQ